ncbi:PIN domain-containing protein [Spirosoma foliorum]|uniref:PIN domain-containing protein n=1 Tax=Spirosoma foliorum TaxID=2710596 RepID=A0A7G5GTM1_9BACT|nr:PIN domain-containing protein [Spirosoma foliorum]QMW02213.1 PIN domain-containing protein [Spirosoma foliorum]
MLFLLDTNVLINLIRRNVELPPYSAISIITVAELKAFATKRKWGYQKRLALEKILGEIPIFGIEFSLTDVYATIDAYSQGELMNDPLPVGVSARNMGKNDIWIAATALFYDAELHTSDNDFDHLPAIGLRLNKIGSST